ncbi:MAG: ATP-binding cassette domain-containing protein [Candidatus Lokiarchaeota archaeon]|nr:ATP-binding cassette domain-containing protein [Candidatus Lokiarchaeota archaeon]
MNVIELEDVSKAYGEIVAISRFTMRVKSGSITGFVGPNGAGKSTTIRIITGLARPDEGTIRIFGEDPYDNPGVKSRIGFVSEHDDLYPWARVKESVSLLARLSQPLKREISSDIDWAISAVGMHKFKERPVSQLSKGMRQRVKIAAALVHHPELLVLDEPMGGLDPLGRKTVMDLLKRLNKDEQVSILVSSHVLEELEYFVNRLTLIHRGQALAEGAPDQIRSFIFSYPHEITYSAKESDMSEINSQVITKSDIVRTMSLNRLEDDIMECKVITSNPEEFYDELIRIAVELKAPILSIDTESESVEKLFEFLVS